MNIGVYVGSLRKISGIVGKVIKIDNATQQKSKLRFARDLVEMNTNGEFPEEIHFTNVKEELITQQVIYEWKPILCNKCQKMGHYDKDCKVGLDKEKTPKPDRNLQKDKEGFQVVMRKQ